MQQIGVLLLNPLIGAKNVTALGYYELLRTRTARSSPTNEIWEANQLRGIRSNAFPQY